MHCRLRSWLHRLLPTIALLSILPGAVVAAPRLALVVGNAAYPGRPLATSAADAGLVAQALAQAGFEVTAAMDLDGKRLRALLRGFADQARVAGPEARIVVYLAGYGVQYDSDNYYVPVDAALAHDDDVPLQAFNLADFARALAAGKSKARVLLYDLARTNPFAAGDDMPLAPGLAIGAPPADTLVAFGAAPGMVAPDSAPPYGAYARALAEALGTPGVTPARMLERVRLRVGTLTNGAQVPWAEGTLDPTATLASGAGKAGDLPALGTPSVETAYSGIITRDSLDGYADFLRAVPDGPLAIRARVMLAVRREALTWRAAALSDDPRAAWTYMRRYPRGPHLYDARRRLAALKAQLEPPPRFDPFAFPGLPAPAKGEADLLARPAATLAALPAIPAPPAALLPAPDAAYGDALPPPAPAPAGVLPIAAALPLVDDQEPGEITQMPQAEAGNPIVTRTSVAPGGGAALTLSDKTGTLITLATIVARDGTRTILETGPKNALLSRTTTTRVGDAITTIQANGSGAVLTKTTARSDPDGGRIVRVVDGADALLATWRRDASGIILPGESAGDTEAQAAAPVAPAPTSPTVAVPPAQLPVVPAAPAPRVAAAPGSGPSHSPAPAPAAATPPRPAASITPAPPPTSPPRLTSDALSPPPVGSPPPSPPIKSEPRQPATPPAPAAPLAGSAATPAPPLPPQRPVTRSPKTRGAPAKPAAKAQSKPKAKPRAVPRRKR